MQKSILEMVWDMFKEDRKFDKVDEKTFENKSFQEELYDELEEFNVTTDKSEILDVVARALTFHQYGDTSDTDDITNIKEDLNARNLNERFSFI